MTDSQTIFVYGTLRRDPESELSDLLARHWRFIGAATVQGRLFDLGAYPGLVLDETNGHVSGELYQITTSWPQVIERLDEYEGCTTADPQPHEYRRELVEAMRPSGDLISAWAYVLNRDPHGLPIIESGDYLTWRASGRRAARG